MANLRPPSSSTEHSDTLLKPNKMFLFVQLPTIIPTQSLCQKDDTVILTLALKFSSWLYIYWEPSKCQYCMSTEFKPVFNLRTKLKYHQVSPWFTHQWLAHPKRCCKKKLLKGQLVNSSSIRTRNKIGVLSQLDHWKVELHRPLNLRC